MADSILDQALLQLHQVQPQIDRAEKLVKVLSEAGQPVSDQQSQLAALKVQRQKYMDVLKANGAELPSTSSAE